jgi:putative FmdB family regulatory protein
LGLILSREAQPASKPESVQSFIATTENNMPTYEYRCRDCHHVFDRIEPLAEHGRTHPECPKCKSRKVEQVFTPFFAKTSHKS